LINYIIGRTKPKGTRVLDSSGSDSGSDSRPKGDGKRKRSKNQQPNPATTKRYQHISELHKNMREALRVNKAFTVFLLYLR
jgi:hypothetical protein